MKSKTKVKLQKKERLSSGHVVPNLPPWPPRYTVEIVQSDGDRTICYANGLTRRIEMYPKAGRPIHPSHPSIVISRADKRVIWGLYPETKTYSQAKMPPHFERAFNPDTLSEWSEEGTEIIDGRKCRRFVGRYLDEHSQPIGDAHEVRFIDAKTGLPRRELDFDMRGKLVTTTEYLNAKIGPPPRHVFEIPKGYKRGYHRTKRVHA